MSSSKFGLKSKSRSSEESVSSSSTTASGLSGVDALRFDFLLCFPFLGMIELAQDLTFRGLWLDFFDFIFVSSTGPTFKGDARGDELKVVVRAGSDMLVGSLRWVDLSLFLDSKRKNPRFLVGMSDEVGLGPAEREREEEDTADMGRLQSDTFSIKGLLRILSRTAPAVPGRLSSSTVLSTGVLDRVNGGLMVLPPTMDDKLFAVECPRSVDASVSEEMVESGRMYSTLSEKPTRAREGGRGVDSSSELLLRKQGCDMDLLTEWPNLNSWRFSAGVLGALPVRDGKGGTGGLMIADKSWEEIAAERRWAWPRRPVGGPAGGPACNVVVGGDREPSFVGLLLSNVAPVRALPPMSSLPPRR